MSLSNSDLALALKQELKEYDGKSTAILGEVAHRWSQEPDYPNALLDIFATDNPVLQNGASWLFKSFLEKGGLVEGDLPKRLARQLDYLTDWAAMLHVCQSIQHLTFAEEDARLVANWVLPLLKHNRPFLRAWALDALIRLSSLAPKLRHDARDALTKALDDPAASVRARTRKLEKAVRP